jgi:hypothetical protein
MISPELEPTTRLSSGDDPRALVMISPELEPTTRLSSGDDPVALG